MARRTFLSRNAMILDVGLAVAVVLVGVWRETRFPAGDRRMIDLPVAVYATVQILGGITLLARRRWPLGTGLANAVLNLVSPTQASFVAAYTLGAHTQSRRRGIATFVVVTLCWILGRNCGGWRILSAVRSCLSLPWSSACTSTPGARCLTSCTTEPSGPNAINATWLNKLLQPNDCASPATCTA